MKADVNVLNSIRQRLEPIGVVYRDHPVLKRSAAYSILMNLPMVDLSAMCHKLNTNIQGLMELLVDRDVISMPSITKKTKNVGGGLFD